MAVLNTLGLLSRPAAYRTVREPALPDLSDEDRESLLRSITSGALSGIGYVGGTLDKLFGGRAVRNLADMLAGGKHWSGREFLSLIPGSDTLGITKPENQVDEWELLSDLGIKNKPGFDSTDVLAFGVGAALDPATYLSGGLSALGKTGKAARSAGVLDDLLKSGKAGKTTARITPLRELAADAPEAVDKLAKSLGKKSADIGDETLGGLLGAGLPGLGSSRFGTIGTGPVAQKIAGGWDKAKDALRFGKIPGTNASPGMGVANLFNPSTMGASTRTGQEVAEPAFQALKDSHAQALAPAVKLAHALWNLGPEWRGSTLDQSRRLRRILEGVDDVPPELQSIVDEFKSGLEDLRVRLDESGIPGGAELADEIIEYAPRYLSGTQNLPKSFGDRAGGVLGVPSRRSRERLQSLKNLGQGTDTVVQIAVDPEFRKLRETFKGDRAGAESEIYKWLQGSRYADQIPETYSVVRKGVEKTRDQRKELAKVLAGLPDEAVQTGVFGNFPLADALRHATSGYERLALGEKTLGLFADKNVMAQARKEAASLGDTAEQPLWQLLGKPSPKAAARLGFRKSELNVAEDGFTTLSKGYDTKLAELQGVDLRAAQPGDQVLSRGKVWKVGKNYNGTADRVPVVIRKKDPATGKMVKQEAVVWRDSIQNLSALKKIRNQPIPRPFAQDIARMHDRIKGPKAVGTFVKWLDGFTSAFKAGVLTWPARFNRDFASAQVQNMLFGVFNPKTVWNVGKMLNGGVYQGIEKVPYIAKRLADEGLDATAENGTAMLRRVVAEQQISGRQQQQLASHGLDADSTLEGIIDRMPGARSQGLAAGVKRFGKTIVGSEPGTSRNPLDIRGIGDRTETKFGPVAAGEQAGQTIESMNRIPPFVELLKKGYTPEDARSFVERIQADYTKFGPSGTPFQRDVMARAFPFWRFSRAMIPLVAGELATRPGGPMGQSIALANSLRDTGLPVPEYVGETLSIPLGQRDDGSLSFLTGLGLMHEQPLELLGENPLLQLIGQANPAAKLPLEAAFGQSTFQVSDRGGRPLDEVDPPIGRLLSNVTGRDRPYRLPLSVEHVVANSPLSRAVTTARTLTDPRKGLATKLLNTTTGARVSDISPASQDAVVRDAIESQMRSMGASTFERIRFSEDALAVMQPDERHAALRYNSLLNELAKRAKERRSMDAQQAASAGSQ